MKREAAAAEEAAASRAAKEQERLEKEERVKQREAQIAARKRVAPQERQIRMKQAEAEARKKSITDAKRGAAPKAYNVGDHVEAEYEVSVSVNSRTTPLRQLLRPPLDGQADD